MVGIANFWPKILRQFLRYVFVTKYWCFCHKLQTDKLFSFLKLKIWILVIFKASLASHRQPSCPYKPLAFQTLRHLQSLRNFQSPKFKFLVSGKKLLSVWRYDKSISIFWQKCTFINFKSVASNSISYNYFLENESFSYFQSENDMSNQNSLS